jgi:prefoldin subunit 1
MLIGRFVFSPTSEVEKRLTTETSDLKSDVENLGKKLQYLETTHKNSREHIDQIFNSRGRA